MSTAVGLRNERLRLYERRNSGSDGDVNAVFWFVAERWGRLDEKSAVSIVSQGRVQLKLDASAEFADEVDVPDKGIIIDTAEHRAWWVRSINRVTQLRRIVVGVERVTDEQFKSMTVYDDPPGDSAAHLVDPAVTPPFTMGAGGT